MGRKYTDSSAREIAKSAGYTPEEDYPGRVKDSWRVRCDGCKVLRRVTLTNLIHGRSRCKHAYGKFAEPTVLNEASRGVAEGYEAGASIRALSRRYKISYGAVHNRLRDAGVQLRQRGGDMRSKSARARYTGG